MDNLPNKTMTVKTIRLAPTITMGEDDVGGDDDDGMMVVLLLRVVLMLTTMTMTIRTTIATDTASRCYDDEVGVDAD